MKNKYLLSTILLLLIAFVTTSLSAQNLRVYVGPSFSTWGYKNTGFYMPEVKYRAGFHVSTGYEIPLNEHLSLEPRLQFNSKGVKMNFAGFVEDLDEEYEFVYSTSKMRLNYIEVPILIKGKFDIGGEKNIFFNFGPIFSVGLVAKYVEKYDGMNYVDKGTVKFGEEGIKRFDCGLKTEVGFEYKKYSAAMFFDQGLVNLSGDFTKIRNRSLGISLGYKIPTKKE